MIAAKSGRASGSWSQHLRINATMAHREAELG
jgi:hypothetical protein